MNLNIVDLKTIEYGKCLEFQYALHKKRVNNEIQDTLLLLEHNSVITLGTRGDYNNIYLDKEKLKEFSIDIFEVNRGGDVTYHGPGQIVGYLIMDLKSLQNDLKEFVKKMEQSIINLLNNNYSLKAYRQQGKFTGVWLGEKKIAAIGIEAKKWVTMHGFAFNINTNLEHFKLINPCGLSKEVTSLEQQIGFKEDIQKVKEGLAINICNEYQRTPIKMDIKELLDNK